MEDRGNQAMQLVVLNLSGELYGIEVGLVREVTPVQRVTRLPRAPSYLEGVTNLRGRVVPVIDLRLRLSLRADAMTEQSRIAVVEMDGGQVGMLVDAVQEVIRVPTDAIEPPSSLLLRVDRPYVKGVAKVGESLITVLDLRQVLSLVDRKVV